MQNGALQLVMEFIAAEADVGNLEAYAEEFELELRECFEGFFDLWPDTMLSVFAHDGGMTIAMADGNGLPLVYRAFRPSGDLLADRRELLRTEGPRLDVYFDWARQNTPTAGARLH